MTKLEEYLTSYLSDLESTMGEIGDFDASDELEKFGDIHSDLRELKGRFPLPVPVSRQPDEVAAGIVLEKEREGRIIPLTIAVLRLRGELADVSLMSYAYELATEHDLIIPFSHLLRDTWVLEGDLIYSVPLSYLKDFSIISKIQDEDCELMVNYLDGKLKALPSGRKGAGSFLDVKRRFKAVEQQRSAFLASFVFLAVDEAESEGLWEEEIRIPLDLRKYLNLRADEVPAAGMEEDTFLNNYVSGSFNDESQLLQLHIYEEFHGKFGRLEFKRPGGSIVLYEGIFKKGMSIMLRSVQRSDLFSFKNNLQIVLF